MLIQVLLQPLFLLFIFGKILPSIGAAQSGYAAVLLPGIVAFTIFLTGVQGVFNPLTYTAEGLRYAMTPVLHGQSTLPPIWSLTGLSVSSIFLFFISLRTFRRRVIS